MTATEEPSTVECPRCRHTVRPRGGVPPHFCAVCGQRLASAPAEVEYAPRPRGSTPPAATAALLLGLCSLIPICGLPLGVLAIVLGTSARRQIERSAGQLGGEGLATAGLTLGIITSVFWTLVCLGAR